METFLYSAARNLNLADKQTKEKNVSECHVFL